MLLYYHIWYKYGTLNLTMYFAYINDQFSILHPYSVGYDFMVHVITISDITGFRYEEIKNNWFPSRTNLCSYNFPQNNFWNNTSAMA